MAVHMRLKRLDHRGNKEILKSQGVTKEIDRIGELVHGALITDPDVMDYHKRYHVDTDRWSGQADRAINVIAILSPLGMVLETRHGVLTHAAASVGLEVTSRRPE